MSHKIIEMKDKMDKAGVPFTLMASTLLGIYRDGEPKGPIYEFAALASDITESRIAKLDKLGLTAKRRSDSGLAILDFAGYSENGTNFEVHLVYFKNGYGFHNISGDEVLVWPEKIWRKKNWGTVKWEGIKWNTPGDVEEYLRLYYGNDWRTPQTHSWGGAANLRKLIDLKGNVEFLKKE